MRYLKRFLVALAAVLVVAVTLGFVWTLNPSQAEQAAYDAAMANPNVITEVQGDFIVIQPKDGQPKVGLLFYPGMHVASEAYTFKLASIVEATGIGIVVGRPPLSMAFLAINQADDMRRLLPEVETWYVGGHSMGGAVACLYAKSNADALDGVILFGTYCGSDLASTDLRVLIISGGNDGLFPPDEIESKRSDLPASARVEIIPGMNHAQFGNYGEQFGDAPALISDDEALAAITAAVEAFFRGGAV